MKNILSIDLNTNERTLKLQENNSVNIIKLKDFYIYITSDDEYVYLNKSNDLSTIDSIVKIKPVKRKITISDEDEDDYYPGEPV